MSTRIMAEARRQQEEVEAEGDPLRQAAAASGGRWETTFQLWGFLPRCSAVPRRIGDCDWGGRPSGCWVASRQAWGTRALLMKLVYTIAVSA